MDMDFWAARLQRQIPTRGRNNSDEHSNGMEDGGEQIRAWFPCPFCYTEIELPLFCVHLQEEHCFDLKNAVCPICAANLGKDALGHFTVEHAHSIKRKASYKSGLWSNVSADIVKDLKELSSFLCVDSSASNGQPTAPDPLISPFLSVIPKETQQDRGALLNTAASQSAGAAQATVEEADTEEKRKRATLLHELLFSAIFSA